MRISSYEKVPLKVVGQSYESRSTAVSIQKTMNLIPQAELTGAAESSLSSWPGLTSFYTAPSSGLNRGATVYNNELYQVVDNTLYKIDSSATRTSLGTINGTNRCIFADSGQGLVITTGSTAYYLVGSLLSTITDPEYQGGNSSAFFNTYMVYDGTDSQFQLSEATTASNPGGATQFATEYVVNAESASDDTLRVFVWREQLYVFGERTVETWYFTGSGAPPIARVNNATMQVGLGAVHSVKATDEYVYFLSDDRRVYRFSATQPENITSIAISHQLDKLGDLSGAIGDVIRIEGQSFYKLRVQGRTFVFNENANAWFELSTKADQSDYRFTDFVECYSKRLCVDGANILELDLDTYDNNGEVIINERIFGPITSRELGLGNSRVLMSRLWLDIDAGVGLATGQGEDPQLMVSASFDGGESFTNESDVLMGRSGEGRIDVKWDHCESFRTMFVKIKCSDPVFFCLFGATLEVKPGGI